MPGAIDASGNGLNGRGRREKENGGTMEGRADERAKEESERGAERDGNSHVVEDATELKKAEAAC